MVYIQGNWSFGNFVVADVLVLLPPRLLIRLMEYVLRNSPVPMGYSRMGPFSDGVSSD